MSSDTPTISFDLDGTLTTNAFVAGVWEEGVPSAWAAKHGKSIEQAREYCLSCYEGIGIRSIRWYQLAYWIERLELDELDPHELIDSYIGRLGLFDDVLPVLSALKQAGRRMVIFSNATRIFLDAEIAGTNIGDFFDEIISVPDDWGTIKADPQAFERLHSQIGPFIHVGDQFCGDFEIPQSLGIDAYHIWRGDGDRYDHSLTDLYSFARCVQVN